MPIDNNIANLRWWQEQADTLLSTTVTEVIIGEKTQLITGKDGSSILLISIRDMAEYSYTNAGQWLLIRLEHNPTPATIHTGAHALFVVVWVAILLSAAVADRPSSALFLLIAGTIIAGAHMLYLRSTVHSTTTAILHADRVATDRLGWRAAQSYFEQENKIDGLYRTPIHQLIDTHWKASKNNRAELLGVNK